MTEWTVITAMNKSGYLVKEGLRSIKTNRLMSFASVAVIMACLLIMGCFSLVAVNINSLIHSLEQENEVVVFIDETLTDEEARSIQSSIEAVDNVYSAEYVTSEEAMKSFMEDYDSDLMEGIDKTVFRNRYVIQLQDISLMSSTKSDLEKISGVAKVNAHIDYANSFITIRNVISIVSLILIAILVIVCLFIMTNTIKIATYSRRDEIAIMKMVGATDGFIRLPFIVEGLVLGGLGGIIAFLAMWGLYSVITGRVMESIAGSIVNVIPFSSIGIRVFLVFFIVGIVIGVIGAINAIRNYLKV